MLSSASRLILSASLAFTGVLAAFPRTHDQVGYPSVYFASRDMNWANATFYDRHGNVAVTTKRTGNNISFLALDSTESSIPSPGNPCDHHLNLEDSHGVNFTIHKEDVPGPYTWRFTRHDGPSFVWKPFPHSNISEDPIFGFVTEEGQTKRIAKISVAKVEDIPAGIISGEAVRIQIAKSKDVNDRPTPFELIELLYLLISRTESCKIRFNLIPSSNWPYNTDGGPTYDDGSNDASELISVKAKHNKGPGTDTSPITISISPGTPKELD